MAITWEYARLYMTRDPQSKDSYPVWLLLPDDTAWQKHEEGEFWQIVRDLGAAGWELVGPPTVANGVFTYKAATDVWHDRSIWLEMTYWFKRQQSA